MHRNLILPLLGLVVIGASATAPTAPASSTDHQIHADGLPRAGVRPTGLPSPRFEAAGIQTIAARPENGLAQAPGCAQSAPLFRSHMPRLVAWQGQDRPLRQDATPLRVSQAKGQPEGSTDRQGRPLPDAEDPATTPAMHQAVHLCVVDRFSPQQPLGGASRAVYRL
ncbi:hypothetical protein [Roseomonas sp. USHLN139]|uniref:hypothetical protein n=1 Tax=Roseomonas sp. USHLN139 TaxID=3081298 RepID=UPI003B02288B